MPYSSDNAFGAVEGDDIYQPDHGRYVLMSSPGVGQMQFLGFSKVFYDKKDHTMRDKDSSRPDDFISISGSKMRKLAALAAKPCPPTIPSDLIAAKCMCAAAAPRAAAPPSGRWQSHRGPPRAAQLAGSHRGRASAAPPLSLGGVPDVEVPCLLCVLCGHSPPGFMVQKGWEIVSDYYIRQKTARFRRSSP